jgi:hypothetical protein
MKKDPLRIQSASLAGLLILEYVLGMYVDLFVAFPDGAQGDEAWKFAMDQGPVVAHVAFATLLVLGGIAFLIRVIMLKRKAWLAPAIIGLLAIFVAGGSGDEFIRSQSDAYSYTMALAFIVAFVAYAWGAFLPSHRLRDGGQEI